MLKLLLTEKPHKLEQSNYAETQSYMIVDYSYI